MDLKIMYRILRGRYPLRVGDLVFSFQEPDSDLIAQSYEIYEETYYRAWGAGSYSDDELQNLLIDQGIWSPMHDKSIKIKQDRIEDLKLDAYHNYLNRKMLNQVKRSIRVVERDIEDLLKEKHKLDNMSCHGIAEYARMRWLVCECINNIGIDSQKLLDAYYSSSLETSQIRSIAKSSAWRSMWLAKDVVPLFAGNAVDLSSNQLTLISFSRMYDNVYEHPERPHEDIIDDDECLDGWFIFQRRKSEKEKAERDRDSMIKSPKIKNADEVYIMASTKEDADRINSMNSKYIQNVVKSREKKIEEGGRIKQGNFNDVKQDLEIQKTDLLRSHLKGKRK